MIQDYERGQSDVIRPHPWQTDTCIGDWHYDRSIYEHHQYKTPDQVVKMLVDIVSKNGNLMLNIPLRGDGTIDSDEVAFLQGMAAWMASTAKRSTRPAPGNSTAKGRSRSAAAASARAARPYTSQDFRFTTKGNVLYTTALGWPDDGKLTVRTLAADAPGLSGHQTVSLLGSPAKLCRSRGRRTAWWSHCPRRSRVTMPTPSRSKGWIWRPPSPSPRRPADPCSRRRRITLTPDTADPREPFTRRPPPFPTSASGTARRTPFWRVHFDAPGTYAVTAKTSAARGEARHSWWTPGPVRPRR